MTNYYYQQGDVLLKRVASLPEDAKRDETGERIIQYGEVTGHKHAFAHTAQITLHYADSRRYLEVVRPSALTHEEHKPITVDPGIYEIDIVREYDYDRDETRSVVD